MTFSLNFFRGFSGYSFISIEWYYSYFNNFSDLTGISECSNGYQRRTLILKVENLGRYADATGSLRNTDLTLYWNEINKEWGKPNEKHYWIQDIKHVNGIAIMPIESADDYNRRYAKYDKKDLCISNFPVFCSTVIRPTWKGRNILILSFDLSLRHQRYATHANTKIGKVGVASR